MVHGVHGAWCMVHGVHGMRGWAHLLAHVDEVERRLGREQVEVVDDVRLLSVPRLEADVLLGVGVGLGVRGRGRGRGEG